MASARGTSKGLGGMHPRKVIESERRKNGWCCPVSAGTDSSSLSCRVEPVESRVIKQFDWTAGKQLCKLQTPEPCCNASPSEPVSFTSACEARAQCATETTLKKIKINTHSDWCPRHSRAQSPHCPGRAPAAHDSWNRMKKVFRNLTRDKRTALGNKWYFSITEILIIFMFLNQFLFLYYGFPFIFYLVLVNLLISLFYTSI